MPELSASLFCVAGAISLTCLDIPLHFWTAALFLSLLCAVLSRSFESCVIIWEDKVLD